MSIIEKFFKKKEPKPSSLEMVKPLFQSYLISSAANYQSLGLNCLESGFTSIAVEQPVTFFEYCKDFYDQIVFSQSENLDLINLMNGRNNAESFQLRSAYNILSNNFSNPNFQYLCGCVSAVYESALATSNKSMLSAYATGKDATAAELRTPVVEELQNNYSQKGLESFTRDGFARKTLPSYDQPSILRDTTVNARETVSEVLEEPYGQFIVKELTSNPTSEFYNKQETDIVDISLSIIREGTFSAQNMIENYNRTDFMLPTNPTQA